MTRCTEWSGEHAAVVDNHVNYIDRLARYEDTGLEPEELAALAAPHGDLVDRNTLFADLYAIPKFLGDLAANGDAVLINASMVARKLPAIIRSNEESV